LLYLVQAQKAKEREEDEHLVDKLDSDFASLAQTQALLSLTESAKFKVNKSNSSAGLTGKEIFTKVFILCMNQKCFGKLVIQVEL
jgi:nucleolar protein 14